MIAERPSCELEVDVAQSVGIQNVTRNLPTAEARSVRDARVFRVGDVESLLDDQRKQIRQAHDHIEDRGIHLSVSSAAIDYGCCSASTVPGCLPSDAGTLRSISERIGRMNENR